MRSMWKWHGKSVWFMSFVFFPDEPETRDAWWEEIRQEIKSHAKALGCHAVVGYSESTSIWCVINVSTEYNTFRYCLFFFLRYLWSQMFALFFYIYIVRIYSHQIYFCLILSDLLFSSLLVLTSPTLISPTHVYPHFINSRLMMFHLISSTRIS